MSILNRLFGTPEEINGHNRCETYLYRWIVWSTRWFKIYLHHFVADDWSRDLHDHPKRFISIGIKGSYWEDVPTPLRGYDRMAVSGWYSRYYCAPWIRSFPATHIHRLRVPYKDTWTLVIVLKTIREWGFWHDGRFIPWRDYVTGKDSGLADRMKDCN